MKRLDEALRPGGLTYTASGQAIDANGNPLEDAPERPEDTKPEDQPHNRAALGLAPVGNATGTPAIDMNALGRAIGEGIALAGQRAEADDRAQRAHEEVRDAAVNAKPSGAPALVPSSATADLGTGVPRNATEEKALEDAKARAPESGVSGVAPADALRGMTEAQAQAAREAAAKVAPPKAHEN